MANKTIDELVEATSIGASDLFVLKQTSGSRKLKGQVLLNWLTAAADGHGGISGISKKGTSGLVDTYILTMADTTTFEFSVTNGNGISGIQKTGTSGLVDTYTVTFTNGTSTSFTVTNGAKGDTGAASYVWIRYASQQPTASSHSMGTDPDKWIGVYSGTSATAPTDWTAYTWYEYKGEKGDTGTAATVSSAAVTYQSSTSGTVVPSGTWSAAVPTVTQGQYLWTRTVIQFNSGSPITFYAVGYMGINGSGSVASVCGNAPDASGDVIITAEDVGALSSSGGNMTGAIAMNNNNITGVSTPTADTDAANKSYTDTKATAALKGAVTSSNAYTDRMTQTLRTEINGKAERTTYSVLIPASDWSGDGTSGYTCEVEITGITDMDTPHISPVYSGGDLATALAEKAAWNAIDTAVAGSGLITFYAFEEQPTTDLTVTVEVVS